MEKFEITILGCGSALPTMKHYNSSQVINIREKLFMIDCGEGTQIQFRRNKLKFSKLNHIFISHMHGDHFFGLIGLVSTLGLLGRTATLHIYGPKDLCEVLMPLLKFFCNGMTYQIEIHIVDTKSHELIYEDRSLEIYSIPLKHRIACSGYLFKEKEGLRHIKPEKIKALDVPISQINNIKAGLDYTCPNGEVIKNETLTTPPSPARSYAYCSDTIFIAKNAEILKDVDVIYHEATFCEEDKRMCKQTYHSTAKQAAEIAKLSNAGKLIIGHFSSRYEDENILLEEAKSVFSNTFLAKESQRITI